MNQHNNTPSHKRQNKDKQLIVNYIIKEVEKGTGLNISELKKQYSEDRLFYEALKHITTTKKALCKALNINIDNACWYKRNLEKDGLLIQSSEEVICPYTKHQAHLISTNPKEFDKLRELHTPQLSLFD